MQSKFLICAWQHNRSISLNIMLVMIALSLSACMVASGVDKSLDTAQEISQSPSVFIDQFSWQSKSSDTLWKLSLGSASAEVALAGRSTGILQVTPFSLGKKISEYRRVKLSFTLVKSRFGRVEAEKISFCGIPLSSLGPFEAKWGQDTSVTFSTTQFPDICQGDLELSFQLRAFDQPVNVTISNVSLLLIN